MSIHPHITPCRLQCYDFQAWWVRLHFSVYFVGKYCYHSGSIYYCLQGSSQEYNGDSQRWCQGKLTNSDVPQATVYTTCIFFCWIPSWIWSDTMKIHSSSKVSGINSVVWLLLGWRFGCNLSTTVSSRFTDSTFWIDSSLLNSSCRDYGQSVSSNFWAIHFSYSWVVLDTSSSSVKVPNLLKYALSIKSS